MEQFHLRAQWTTGLCLSHVDVLSSSALTFVGSTSSAFGADGVFTLVCGDDAIHLHACSLSAPGADQYNTEAHPTPHPTHHAQDAEQHPALCTAVDMVAVSNSGKMTH
jgi:hypothetical protein